MKANPGRLWIDENTFLEGELYAPSKGSPYSVGGEITFTTGMLGYPETMTDPSFAGQFICFTSPMIGNYSWETTNLQSKKIHCAGIITHETTDEKFINTCLDQGVPVFTNTNTRLLTLKLRDQGAKIGIITSDVNSKTMPKIDFDYDSTNWVEKTSGFLTTSINSTHAPIALWDLGAKQSIYDQLVKTWGSCAVIPATASIEEIQKYPRLMISNGPGNPSVLKKQISILQNLIGTMPIQAICLGHQLAGLAVGAKVQKMKFGHRGVNHPVQNILSKKVFITSQNHGFEVNAESLPDGCQVTHRSLFDNSLEGFEWSEKKLHCVQFHPEAAPGPEDTNVLFKEFYELYS